MTTGVAGQRPGPVLPRASYRRLRQIKASYDPGQAIISAHPVMPTAAH